jgi:hypothetical protein
MERGLFPDNLLRWFVVAKTVMINDAPDDLGILFGDIEDLKTGIELLLPDIRLIPYAQNSDIHEGLLSDIIGEFHPQVQGLAGWDGGIAHDHDPSRGDVHEVADLDAGGSIVDAHIVQQVPPLGFASIPHALRSFWGRPSTCTAISIQRFDRFAAAFSAQGRVVMPPARGGRDLFD